MTRDHSIPLHPVDSSGKPILPDGLTMLDAITLFHVQHDIYVVCRGKLLNYVRDFIIRGTFRDLKTEYDLVNFTLPALINKLGTAFEAIETGVVLHQDCRKVSTSDYQTIQAHFKLFIERMVELARITSALTDSIKPHNPVASLLADLDAAEVARLAAIEVLKPPPQPKPTNAITALLKDLETQARKGTY